MVQTSKTNKATSKDGTREKRLTAGRAENKLRHLREKFMVSINSLIAEKGVLDGKDRIMQFKIVEIYIPGIKAFISTGGLKKEPARIFLISTEGFYYFYNPADGYIDDLQELLTALENA